MKIRKVVIPVAGFGTRFLPATKASPKEMLPVVDKPIVQYVVEEAVASGMTDVILVTGQGKRAVEDHFDYNHELQHWLKKQGKEELREEMKRIADMANFIYVRQKGPYGNGTPVLCAEHIVGNEPFAVLWGDEFFVPPLDGKPRLAQLLEVFEKYTDPVLTARKVSLQETEKYGILEASQVEKNVYQVKNIVEKPGRKKAPSLLASLGGFVFTPDIFEALRQTPLGKNGELWLVDAVMRLAKHRPLYACEVQATYYDTGSKFGLLRANIDEALRRPELGEQMKAYLKSLV